MIDTIPDPLILCPDPLIQQRIQTGKGGGTRNHMYDDGNADAST